MREVVSRLLPRTVRGRVAMVLNGTLLILFVAFLVCDYNNDSADRRELKRAALEEQAGILVPGILAKQAPDEIRGYLAETRRQMEDTHADQHIIAAEVGGRFYQSGRPAEEDAGVAGRLLETAGTGPHIVEIGRREFLLGRHQQGATVVYVAEDMKDVSAAIRADLQRHLVAVAIALLCGIAIINVTLWLAFHRPLAVLTGAVAEIGSGKLGVQIDRIGTVEFDILAGAINDMSQALAEVESARSAQMRKARTIQDSLHPRRMLLDAVTIAQHYQPTETVGGDYYDLLVLPDGSGLFCIADVTGHGLSAALVAAMMKVCLLDAVERSCDPGEVLGFVNRRLGVLDLPEIFVSMLLVRIRQGPAGLEFAGAGHPPALLADPAGRCRQLESAGPVLGIDSDFSWTTQREQFAPGERLLLYTDGVTEAFGHQPGLFGLARLQEGLLAARDVPPHQAVQVIVRRLAEFCEAKGFLDDVTLVLAELRVASG